MKSADIGFCPGRQRAVKVPPLIVGCAGGLQRTSITARRRCSIHGQRIVGLHRVQSQPLALRALIVVLESVVFKASLGELQGALEAPLRQPADFTAKPNSRRERPRPTLL